MTVSWALKFYRRELSDSVCLYFPRTYLSVPLEDVSFKKRHQQDTASPHYTHEVRQLLSETYLGRWNGHGRESPCSWPTHSPDLNPLVFSVYIVGKKLQVYVTAVDIRKELCRRIQ